MGWFTKKRNSSSSTTSKLSQGSFLLWEYVYGSRKTTIEEITNYVYSLSVTERNELLVMNISTILMSESLSKVLLPLFTGTMISQTEEHIFKIGLRWTTYLSNTKTD
jgi:hypothetical protein